MGKTVIEYQRNREIESRSFVVWLKKNPLSQSHRRGDKCRRSNDLFWGCSKKVWKNWAADVSLVVILVTQARTNTQVPIEGDSRLQFLPDTPVVATIYPVVHTHEQKAFSLTSTGPKNCS